MNPNNQKFIPQVVQTLDSFLTADGVTYDLKIVSKQQRYTPPFPVVNTYPSVYYGIKDETPYLGTEYPFNIYLNEDRPIIPISFIQTVIRESDNSTYAQAIAYFYNVQSPAAGGSYIADWGNTTKAQMKYQFLYNNGQNYTVPVNKANWKKDDFLRLSPGQRIFWGQYNGGVLNIYYPGLTNTFYYIAPLPASPMIVTTVFTYLVLP
jgi:hypothetical protein